MKRRVMRRLAAVLSAAACLSSVAVGLPVAAQVPPSAEEIAAYRGLHAAAHRGDVAAIERLAVQSPAPREAREARDAQGRTALHVATHARQPAAVKALLLAGADSGTLDGARYDAVTVAAVADDEQTLRILLAHGASAKLASTKLTDRSGRTPLQLARERGYAAMVQMLEAAGAP